MLVPRGFQVDQRVDIAMDALSASQKAALKPVLQNKERFVAHSKLPGVTKKLSGAKPLYTMKAGPGMRIIFTVQEDNILVLDVMRKATMDRLTTKRKNKTASTKKSLSHASVK
jgi:mRNA-degrading endonuclease RelE of RelBE toxin-antitoxin system